MKKTFILILLISVFGNAFAQTILNRFPIELKKSSDYFQIYNAKNQENDYFTFITDKEKNTVLKYNSALFFKDSLSVPRPNKEFDFMAGVTFSLSGNPNLYWASKDYKTLKLITFDFINHTTSELIYENDFSREKIIDVFVAQNTIHILSITPEDELKCTNFSNSGKSESLISLSSANSTDVKSIEDRYIDAVLENGITKIESDLYTPLFVGISKVKRYLNKTNYILSIDLKGSTTLFSIDLKDFTVEKEVFPYANLEDHSGSNSFLHQGVLYQISINAEELSLSGIELKTKKALGNYRVNSKQDIYFKSSPLILQTESGKTKEFKNTRKFLSKIDIETVGLSVYSTPNYNLFTIGGVREVPSGGGLALTIGLGIGGAMSGSDVMIGSDFMTTNMQSMYFESFFDTEFKPKSASFQPLYIDQMSTFLDKNHPSAYTVTSFENYVILNYYDSKNKEFVMRKFEDRTD